MHSIYAKEDAHLPTMVSFQKGNERKAVHFPQSHQPYIKVTLLQFICSVYFKINTKIKIKYCKHKLQTKILAIKQLTFIHIHPVSHFDTKMHRDYHYLLGNLQHQVARYYAKRVKKIVNVWM